LNGTRLNGYSPPAPLQGSGGAFLSVAAAAELLDCDPEQILFFIHSKQLAAVNIAAKRSGRPRWRIAVAAFRQLLFARQTVATPKTTRQRRREKEPVFFLRGQRVAT
jgi:hypothetical protein